METDGHGDAELTVDEESGRRIRENLATVREQMSEATRRAGRPKASVRLVAVTKKAPTAWAAELVRLGQYELGENYPQELWRKVEVMRPFENVRWHLIGHLQSNKAKRTFPLVEMIHGVDSLKLLRFLDELVVPAESIPSVCLQVNLSEEESKHGWDEAGILEDAEAIASMRRIPVVGLMTIAGWGTTAEEARPTFARLRELRDQLCQATGLPLPELSMGMSNDFEAAIEEGATWIRVGSSLFEGLSPP